MDAPELPGSPKREDSRLPYAKGWRARETLRAFLATGAVQVQRLGVDRYGRTLAVIPRQKSRVLPLACPPCEVIQPPIPCW
ncbi:hypothetical protein [Novosphingobium sp.]|uniref:hypothetical protein n=1 Tax=Novosphingobium sp. TaxID=1874826 RepID=UPI003BAAD8E2